MYTAAFSPTELENAVLSKLTYGATPQLRAEYLALGHDKWLADQLDPNKAEDASVVADLAGFKSLTLTQAEILQTAPYAYHPSLLADELAMVTLYRRLKSSRQVYETLVEFLQDYVPVPLQNEAIVRLSYDRDAIRPNVLKTYPELLWAASIHPSMLYFLSGFTNTKQHPNENFGRELLELFTVTTATGYSQDDVVNAARVFSGIGWDQDRAVQVRRAAHWFGPVKVLDWSNTNADTADNTVLSVAQSLVTYLALRPETARAFSVRMARRYVADQPTDALIAAMAAKYTATQGSIPDVFLTMVNHPSFLASLGAKLKRPAEHHISTMRVLGVDPLQRIKYGNLAAKNYFEDSGLQVIYGATIQAGHEPFGWRFPNGYPDTEQDWTTLSAQIFRWNNANYWVNGSGQYTPVDWKTLYKDVKDDWSEIAFRAQVLILGRNLSAAKTASLIANAQLANNVTAASATRFEERCKVMTLLLLVGEEWNRR
jgi:uncharacterized protein (DUF1800 family)